MLHFHKAHAYGNDFLYVPEGEAAGLQLPRLAQEMCDRHTGVGADGLIVYERGAAGWRMVLFNADGGRAEVSGNGLRGLAAVVLADNAGLEVETTIDTDAGSKRVVRKGPPGPRAMFESEMGQPTDLRGNVAIEADGEAIRAVELRIGNPQCVILGALPDRARFERLGAAVERHTRFPGGTNVAFADVETPERVRVLIWERGVGPTRSSGTGSCAALVAAAAFGGAAREADVVAPGGIQRVRWHAGGVTLTGWAEVLCHGRWLRTPPV